MSRFDSGWKGGPGAITLETLSEQSRRNLSIVRPPILVAGRHLAFVLASNRDERARAFAIEAIAQPK